MLGRTLCSLCSCHFSKKLAVYRKLLPRHPALFGEWLLNTFPDPTSWFVAVLVEKNSEQIVHLHWSWSECFRKNARFCFYVAGTTLASTTAERLQSCAWWGTFSAWEIDMARTFCSIPPTETQSTWISTVCSTRVSSSITLRSFPSA